MLIARLATKRAKPNGQLHIPQAGAAAFLASLPVSALPGVGWSLEGKLRGLGITQVI